MTPRTYRVSPQAESPDTTFDHPAALTNSRIRSGRLRIPCPAHGETDPTLALWVNGDGVADHCHTAGLPHCSSWLRPNSSTLSFGGGAKTTVSALEPYVPPNVPHGLPHVVRFATLSSMDLPLEVRFLIIMIARFADVHGVASVANSTLGEICRIGSHHTVERWISLAADVGILRKEPGKGGKDRKSNSYTFLGADRSWAPLPVDRPDTNPIVQPFSRRLFHPLLPRRDGHSTKQLQQLRSCSNCSTPPDPIERYRGE